jgi:hypothetical protein
MVVSFRGTMCQDCDKRIEWLSPAGGFGLFLIVTMAYVYGVTWAMTNPEISLLAMTFMFAVIAAKG